MIMKMGDGLEQLEEENNNNNSNKNNFMEGEQVNRDVKRAKRKVNK